MLLHFKHFIANYLSSFCTFLVSEYVCAYINNLNKINKKTKGVDLYGKKPERMICDQFARIFTSQN